MNPMTMEVSKMRRFWIACLAFALLLSPALIHAEEEGLKPVTWIIFLKAQPMKGEQMTKLLKKVDGPVLDKLLADNAILSWGLAAPETYNGDDASHILWVSVSAFGDIDRVDKAFEAAHKAKSKEENRKIQGSFQESMVPGSRRDLVVRNTVFKRNGNASGTKTKGYIWVANYKCLPGKHDEGTSMYRTLAQPVYEKLLNDGVITSFGLHEQVVHSDPSWTHTAWYFFDDYSAVDKVHAAFNQRSSSRSEEEGAWISARFREVFEPDSHQDRILRVVHMSAR